MQALRPRAALRRAHVSRRRDRAVFTPGALRGRGYATALLGAFLDAERDAGTDLAYLFSDIHPAFYERLGFVTLPSRTIVLRADMLLTERVEVVALRESDATSVRRVFDALDAAARSRSRAPRSTGNGSACALRRASTPAVR